jgi:hypothetical protein
MAKWEGHNSKRLELGRKANAMTYKIARFGATQENM